MPLRYLALAATLAAPIDPPDTDNQPFWTGHPDAATFERAVDARLGRARGLLDQSGGGHRHGGRSPTRWCPTTT